MNSVALLIAVLLAALPGYAAADKIVGRVDQLTIYESQIRGSTEQEREINLRKLFIFPVLNYYMESRRSLWQLTEQETQQLADDYKAALKCGPLAAQSQTLPPGVERAFAEMVGEKAKRQRFIYDNHGRGRVLFQQGGVEAFDATRTLILKLEQEGAFSISDPALRGLALKYWLNEQQSGVLPDPGPDQAFKLEQLVEPCPPGRRDPD